MLSIQNSEALLASSLLVISQLARTATSKHQIERFVQSGIATQILPLLGHPTSANVRARACNLLGNLCRFSDAFYPVIMERNLLEPLIELCVDEDRSTRKFACFAIGNAGFHSDALYGKLEPAVPVLVGLLQDPEDRTRANAAGALGNLARNSNKLIPTMLKSGAVEALFGVVIQGLSSDGGQSLSSIQIALFSLGNLAAHKQCGEKFDSLDILNALDDLEDSISDPTTIKYANRVFLKIQSHLRNKSIPEQQTPMRPTQDQPETNGR